MVENGPNGQKWSKMVKDGGPDLKRAQRTGLSARRALRTKLRGPKGLQLEVGARSALDFQSVIFCTELETAKRPRNYQQHECFSVIIKRFIDQVVHNEIKSRKGSCPQSIQHIFSVQLRNSKQLQVLKHQKIIWAIFEASKLPPNDEWLFSKLASLEATLLEITTESLTRVKCRATTVAKKTSMQASKLRQFETLPTDRRGEVQSYQHR